MPCDKVYILEIGWNNSKKINFLTILNGKNPSIRLFSEQIKIHQKIIYIFQCIMLYMEYIIKLNVLCGFFYLQLG